MTLFWSLISIKLKFLLNFVLLLVLLQTQLLVVRWRLRLREFIHCAQGFFSHLSQTLFLFLAPKEDLFIPLSPLKLYSQDAAMPRWVLAIVILLPRSVCITMVMDSFMPVR